MRKLAALLSLILVLAGGVAHGGEGDTTKGSEPRQETYESPVLSLLLLPVSVLIKVASLLGSEESTKDEQPSPPRQSSH